MDIYSRMGKMALGSRLRRLGETLTEQASQVYQLYDINMQPKWFPVFYSLSSGDAKSIVQIAREIGQSHPSVSTLVKEMLKAEIIEVNINNNDGRKNDVKLSEKGLEINQRIQAQYKDVNTAVENAIDETQHDLWRAIEEWEFLLEQKDLLRRVEQEKKLRESRDVTIVDYQPQYKHAFKYLNEEWINAYFKMEESDYKALDHPEEYILNKGGYILIALYHGEPVGTCALIKIDNDTFELAKMAVSPKAKGKGIGLLLGNAAIDKAKQAEAKQLYLESNTMLKPAINLYHKLGFTKITGIISPYERCNIQMALKL